MRYNGYDEDYGNYGRRERDSRGRYMGNYGRRGVDRRYRGEDAMDEMHEHYMNYNEGREQYGRGNYNGGEQEMVEATEGIMRNVTEIVKELADSDNPQVMQIIQRHAKRIMEM